MNKEYVPPPVRRGEYYDVTIHDIAPRGDGVTFIGGKGFVVLVKDAKVGDKVKIRIERVFSNRAEAIVVDL